MKKHKIEKILIPTDFSETGLLALEHGAFMARLLKAELFLLHVIEVAEYKYQVHEPIDVVRSDDEVEQAAAEKLEAVADRIRTEYGIKVQTLMGEGRPAQGIAELAKEREADLIIMGTHGAKGFEEYFIGSNAQKTVTIASCPVLTVQTHAQKLGFSDIVVPIDNSLHSREKVDHAIALASHYASRVHILGLLNTDEDTNEKKFNIKLDAVEKAVKHAGLVYTRHTVKGSNLAEEALNYSGRAGADLIVVLADHESSMHGAFLGGFAKQIINHSKIPVLSIRPTEGHYSATDLSASSNPFD